MKLPRRAGVLVLFVTASSVCFAAQDFSPAPSQPPDAATRKIIDEKMAKLADLIGMLRAKGPADNQLADVILADVEIFHQSAYWITRHNEFFQKESAAWTVEALDRGLERVKLLSAGNLDWLKSTARTIVRGYRSVVDGSVQPYAVTLPEEYGKDTTKKWRLDVVLHGRDKNLNEVKFLHQHGDKNAPKDLQFIRLDIFGRGNNAYRWAGEMDVLEARNAFATFEELAGRGRYIDKQRQVLRGFSMGGAGTWHLGLHRPDQWCVVGPGAGFTATHGYIKDLPANLQWPVEQCLRIYDAVAYAENAFNVPIVAYAGSKDPQLQAARNIEALLKPAKLPVQFQILIAPDLEHKFPAEWQAKAEEAYAPFINKGRTAYPKRVRFVTYTLKYASCDWVEILGLEKHYEKTLVDADKTEDGFTVATTNVDILRLRVPRDDLHDMTIAIDKQQVTGRPWGSKGGEFHVYLQKQDGKWKATMPQKIAVEQHRKPRKLGGLQGPIDDAFTMPFLCVRATGQPWSARVDDYAAAALKSFQSEWAKYMRGDLPVKNDTDVTSEDIADKHLILFGDPGSNTMIANVLDGLPLEWNAKKIVVATTSYDTATHVPVLICPNPLNPTRYIVLNSGHTFHAKDFQGTNALLYPRLGDYAILRLANKGPALAVDAVEVNGLYDEYWRIVRAGK
jgi:dienelactone hydrolase